MGKRVTVTDGYAVYVNGEQIHGGDTIVLDQATAEHWVARGWAVEAKPQPNPATTKPEAKAPAKAPADKPAKAEAAKLRARKRT